MPWCLRLSEGNAIIGNRARVSLGAATALYVVATACTAPVAGNSSPIPSATPTETQLEHQARLDFEAAEKAYRTFNAEFDRVSQAGGSPTPTRAMNDTAAGPYLRTYSTTLQQQYEVKGRTTGTLVIVSVHRQSYASNKLTLVSCEDGSNIRAYNTAGKLVEKGSPAIMTIEARRVSSHWQLWDFKEQGASKCTR